MRPLPELRDAIPYILIVYSTPASEKCCTPFQRRIRCLRVGHFRSPVSTKMRLPTLMLTAFLIVMTSSLNVAQEKPKASEADAAKEKEKESAKKSEGKEK